MTEHPRVIAALPFEPRRFEVSVVDTAATDHRWIDTEEPALSTARAWLCRRTPHVCVVAHGPDSNTWAIRHLLWEDEAEVDTGWRCWINDEFVGAGVQS